MNDEQNQTPPINPTPTEPVAPPADPAAEPMVFQPTTPASAPDPAVPPTAEPVATPATPAPPNTEPVSPIAPAPEQVANPDTAVPAPAPSGPKKKILLVEDDDALAQVYQTRLTAEGFDIQRVPNGEDALVSALQYHPDLILLDVMMAKVSGFDVLDILRNTPETTNVKIVMLTALGQESDKERAQNLGVDDYMVKSQVVIADVVDRIKHHLGMG
jgi:CheY-like chemotaxis protein